VFIFVVHKSNAKAAQSRVQKVLQFSRQQKAALLVFGVLCVSSAQTDRQNSYRGSCFCFFSGDFEPFSEGDPFGKICPQ